jgi:hypothetical protein
MAGRYSWPLDSSSGKGLDDSTAQAVTKVPPSPELLDPPLSARAEDCAQKQDNASARPAWMETREWKLARRVANSKGLGKSELLPRFLIFVCKLALQGKSRQITEQLIGVQVFNRPEGYDPGEDNIVRGYARTLRKRLETYFLTEGANETMRIVIPRGGYAPVFEPVEAAWTVASALPLAQIEEAEAVPNTLPINDVVPVKAYSSKGRHELRLAILVGFCMGLIAALAVGLLIHVRIVNAEKSPAHDLWMQLFQTSRNTLIVPADSGLGIVQNLTRQQVSLEQYANGSFLSALQAPAGLDSGNFNDLRLQRYTSVVDLDIVSALVRLPEFVPGRTHIRYARGISVEDLMQSNVILIGSVHTNPWVALYQDQFNFRLDYGREVDDSEIVNLKPLANERSVYRNNTQGESAHTYGTVAYLRGLDHNGHVLILHGLNMAATQATADVLRDASQIGPVLKKARRKDGTLEPFELLVETSSIGAAAPGEQIIAVRIHPDFPAIQNAH